MLANVRLLLVGLLILTISSAVVLRAAPDTAALRAAERLWSAGSIAEARQQYLALARATQVPPLVLVRLATIELLRGSCPDAQTYAARAIAQPSVRRDEAAQAHLIAGQCAALRGAPERAEAAWRSVDPRSRYVRLVELLRGEQALRAGHVATAIPAYRAALDGRGAAATPPPELWTMLARFRLALLLAADAPAEAQGLLATIPLALPAPAPETRPFLPLSTSDLAQQSLQLRSILSQPAAQRTQLLGQQLLHLELYRLAIVRFEQIEDGSVETLALAGAATAYARWQLGQQTAATAQLQELAGAIPDSPAVATLYATAAIQAGQLDAADLALNVAEARDPLDPALALVRADVLIGRREYARAIEELRRARDIARPEVRGRYALALSNQHLRLTYDLCGGGISAARDATTIAPRDPAAWQSLAAALYHCRAYEEAVSVARSGLEHAPDHAALRFFLGAALWASDRRDEARPQLLAASDLAPASEWRIRAEQLLGW